MSPRLARIAPLLTALLLIFIPVFRVLATPWAVISEFVASNASGIRDEDGDASDWIEIANPTSEDLDLKGWRLTDSVSQSSKWVFPAGVILPAGGRRVVFASGKNRKNPRAALHTGFSLRAEGEYLALFPPAGSVPATEFRPTFPPQSPNIAFGTGVREFAAPLVVPGSTARIRIPAVGDDDQKWTGGAESANFDDRDWILGTAAVGYDDALSDRLHPLLGYWTFDDVQQSRVVIDSSGQNAHGSLVGSASFTAAGGGRSGQSRDRALDLGAGGNQASVRVDAASRGAFDRLQALDRATVSLWAFGGPELPAPNCVIWFDTGVASGESRNFMVHLPWSDGVIYFDTAGCCEGDTRISRQEIDPTMWRGRWNHYAFLKDGPRKEIWQNGRLWHSGSGAAPLQAVKALWLGSGPDGTSPYPGRIDELAVWAGALAKADIEALAGGLAASAIGSYRPWIQTDLGSSMRGISPRAQLRVPFVVPEDTSPEVLLLKVRYDEGFIAWVNGVELARRNVPAIRSRTKAEGLQPETLPLPVPPGLLRPGTNLLAIEGVQRDSAGADFLLEAELRAGQWLSGRFFTVPSPGEPNAEGVAGLTAPPELSVGRAFLTAPVDVVLSCPTPGAQIRYTGDGSAPSPTHGILVTPASGTRSASVVVNVSQSQALRAMAFAADFEPSAVVTHTYLFADQVARQPARIPGYPATWGVYGAYGPTPGQPVPADYEMDPDVVRNTSPGYSVREAILSLPALCLTTSVSNLFDAATGLYPNSASQGTQWERPASAELVFPDGSRGFQVDAGLRIHGGLSRQHWHALKHSFRLGFSREYGLPRLEFPLFDDSRVTSFNELTLRASSTDGWAVENAEPWTRPKATYLRDPWMKDTQQAMGWPCGHSRYVHLFLNGIYWGQYNLAERTEAVWLSENEGGEPEDYDIIKDVGELEGGNRVAWDQMVSLARNGLASDVAYGRIEGRRPDGSRDPALPVYLDVDSLIDYMILHIYSGAIDWPNHNWWSARYRGASSRGFRFYTWDQEISNISLTATTTYPGEAFEAVSGPQDSPAFLYAKLRANARFRQRFAARGTALTSGFGILTPTQNAARWERRQAEIDHSIVAESARWGDSRQSSPLRRSHWLAEMNWMRNTYWPQIHSIAVGRLRWVGLYGLPEDRAVLITPRGGVVSSGTLVALTGGPEIIWTADGRDPVGPTGEPESWAEPYSTPIPIVGPTEIRARRRLADGWSPLVGARFLTPADVAPESDLEVSEVHYHPVSGDQEQFVEIHNRAASRYALVGGARISGGIDGVLSNAWLLPPDGRAVLVRNPAGFAVRYGGGRPVGGEFLGALGHGGDRIHLIAPSGRILERLQYGDAGGWPVLADGGGPSLTRRRSLQPRDPADFSQWRPSGVAGGTPGWDDGAPFSGVADADADADGWKAVEEYFWGTSDADAAAVPRSGPVLETGSDGVILLRLEHPLVADQAEARWETSADLLSWIPLPGDHVPWVQFDGKTEILSWSMPSSAGEMQFFRLRILLRP